MPDLTDIIIGAFLAYLGYKFLLPVLMKYGWIGFFIFVAVSAATGFAVALSNYIVSMVENMTK